MSSPGLAKVLTGLVVILLGVAAGCATAPIQEMSDARQALQVAREAGAPIHAPASLGRAETMLARAELALRAGEFDEARRSAISARDEAVKARHMAAALQGAKAALAEATTRGCACGQIRELIGQAEEAVRNGEEKKAVELADEAARQGALAVKEAGVE